MIRSFRFVALAIVCIVCLTRPTTAQDAAPSVSPSPPSGFVSRSVSVDGRNVHVLVGGHGAPIMLLHGWPETSYAWHVVAPQLARTRMVIVPDLPGLGDSDSPTGGYDTRNIARILHAMVVQLGVSRIDLVGHDVGMWVAYRYAVDYGASIRRLVLMDAALPGIGAEPPKTRASNMKSFQFALNAVPELPEQLVAEAKRFSTGSFITSPCRLPPLCEMRPFLLRPMRARDTRRQVSRTIAPCLTRRSMIRNSTKRALQRSCKCPS